MTCKGFCGLIIAEEPCNIVEFLVPECSPTSMLVPKSIFPWFWLGNLTYLLTWPGKFYIHYVTHV